MNRTRASLGGPWLIALLAFALAGRAAAQNWPPLVLQPGTHGNATDLFSSLYPSRVKTMIKAGFDPDDRPSAQDQGNDDGFSGLNGSEAYRSQDAGHSLAVLAHFAGRPGVMGLFFRNFWSGSVGVPMYPMENNQTRIWLDGQMRYDMPLRDYFRAPNDPQGQIAPFDGPFTGNRSGGHFTHAQLQWNDSFRIGLWDDGFSNAARFHRVAATLASPENELPIPDARSWALCAKRRGSWPHATPRQPLQQQLQIAANSSAVLTLQGPATILELSCRTANPNDWRDLWAKFSWDGESTPSVDCPLRLLGAMPKPPYSFPMRGLLLGNDGRTAITCFFPMHFERSARLEIENRGAAPVTMQLTTCLAAGAHPAPWGYFTASYHHDVTATGQVFRGPRYDHRRGMLRMLLLEDETDTTGRIPDQHNNHLEGDLCVRINGNRGDDHTFDASETSIGKWGWYITPSDLPFVADTAFNSSVLFKPLAGLDFAVDRVMGSILVFDPIHFVDGIDVVLEHGVQNQSNAEYGLLALLYLQPTASRRCLREIDVGNVADEAAVQAQFTEWRHYVRTGACLRDQFYGTPPITDDVRHIRDFYRFQVSRAAAANTAPIGIGFRLDRLGNSTLKLCQAQVFVDNQYAGLLHSFTHSAVFPWKEGGELEVELPRALTDGRSNFTVEVRPVSGTNPLQIARVWVYEYLR